MFDEVDTPELDPLIQLGVDLFTDILKPGCNGSFLYPNEGEDGDIHIIVYDGSRESAVALPLVLAGMVSDEELSDFGLGQLVEVQQWAEVCRTNG